MGSSFDYGLARAQERSMQREQARSAFDMMQRKFLADQYANVAAQPLPDQKTDPEGYQKALDQRAKALEMQQKVYSPEHHANLFDHIHALITGKQIGADGQPAPQPAPAPDPSVQGAHPFQPHPVLGKIEEGIKALGDHLKAAAHPIAPAPAPDYKMLAAASTPEERKAQAAVADEERKHNFKMQEDAAKLAAKPKPRDPVQRAQWDAESRKLGYTGYDDPKMTADDIEKIASNLKSATTSKTWKTVTDGSNIYAVDAHDPTKRTLIGKKDEVTETHYDVVEPQANGDLVKIPMVRYTRKGSGEKIAELPADSPAPPVSSDAPKSPNSLAPVNANIAAGNAGSKKLNKGKKPPVSANAPNAPGVVGHRPTPEERTTQTQYAKAIPILDAAKQSITDYLDNGIFDGPGDLALQHAFFTATQPSTGFRMTKVQQDILENSRSWKDSWEAKARHATTGTWYSDDQRKKIAKAALEAIKDKKDALEKSMNQPVSSQAPKMPGSGNGVIVVKPEDMK